MNFPSTKKIEKPIIHVNSLPVPHYDDGNSHSVLREPGLQIIQEYIHRKKNTSVNYVSTRTLLDICLGIGQVGVSLGQGRKLLEQGNLKTKMKEGGYGEGEGGIEGRLKYI